VPIYAYKCSACGFAKDTLQKMSDPPLTVCPECGQETFSKQVTAAGFQLKGSGWYVTDFRNNGSAASAGTAAKAGDDKASAASEGKSGQEGEKGSGATATPAAPAAPAGGTAAAPAAPAQAAAPSKPASGPASQA